MDEDIFVSTSHYTHALDLLNRHKVIIISGPPMSGKTTIGKALLRHYDNEGRMPLVLRRFQDFECEPQKSAILLDGVFGEVMVDKGSYPGWANVLRSLNRLVRDGQNVIIMIMYAHIIKELDRLPETLNFSKNVSIVDLSAPLTVQEKSEMLRKHAAASNRQISHGEISDIIAEDRSGHVFPWCCREYAKKEGKHSGPYADLKTGQTRDEIFYTPALAYVPFFSKVLQHPESRGGPLQLFSLAMEGISSLEASLEEIQEDLKYLDLESEMKNVSQMSKWSELYIGSILDKDGRGFQNRHFYDAFGFALYEAGQTELLLKVCDVQFLLEHVHMEAQTKGPVLIIRPKTPSYFTFVFRVMTEIVTGNVVQISQHPAMHQPSFLADLETFLRGRGLSRAAFTVGDPHFGMPLLYWSAWTAPSVLTQWCLRAGKKAGGDRQEVSPGILARTHQSRAVGTPPEPGSTVPDWGEETGGARGGAAMPDWVSRELRKRSTKVKSAAERPGIPTLGSQATAPPTIDAYTLRRTFLACCFLGEKVDTPRVAELLELLCGNEAVLNDAMSTVDLPIPPQEDLLSDVIMRECQNVRERAPLLHLGLADSTSPRGTTSSRSVLIPASIVAVEVNLAKDLLLCKPDGCFRWYTLFRLLSMRDVNELNRDGYTLMHTAAFNGELSVVCFLAANGADLAATTRSGNTPLTKAIDRNQVKVATYILQYAFQGRKLKPQDLSRLCGLRKLSELLSGAVVRRRFEMVRLLLYQGADPNTHRAGQRSLLDMARKVHDNEEVVKVLLRYGAK